MKIKPLFDRVLCRPVTEKTTKSGLYLPTTNAERHQIMTVVATGDACPVAVGDQIIINKYAGAEIADGVDKLYLVQYYDLIGVVE